MPGIKRHIKWLFVLVYPLVEQRDEQDYKIMDNLTDLNTYIHHLHDIWLEIYSAIYSSTT